MNYYKENEHSKKEVVFNQFFGLGDILFIEPLYRHYHEKGYKVITPINEEYIWIQEYIPYVEFHKKSQFRYSYETVQQANDGRLHLPTRFSHPLLRGYELHYGDDRSHWMPDKYEYLGLPVDLWRTLSFKRNEERENKLFDLLQLEGKEYDFYNQNFGGSFENVCLWTYCPKEVRERIDLKKIEGFTLLDWGKVIENATNIYTVETSLVYFLESLNTKGEKHLFPRMPWLPNVDYMKELLGNSWTYHDSKDLL